MQEISLYSCIPASRNKQVLQILAGITASDPAFVFEQYLIFEQLKIPPVPKKAQASNSQRKTYQHLVRSRDESNVWRHRSTDVPEPGLRQFLSQSVTEVPLSDAGLDMFRSISSAFQLAGGYVAKGTRFVQGNVVVTINRTYQQTPSADPIDTTMPTEPDMSRPLDPSGSYTVQACVRVEADASTALRDQAAKELLAFAESLKGAVDLRAPDRLALDPRVKIS